MSYKTPFNNTKSSPVENYLKNNLEITKKGFKFVGEADCLTKRRTKMISTKEKRRLNKELREECWGYERRQDKPDGAYIKVKGIFFNLNKIKRLIEAGADVNAKDVYGRSPLHYAVQENNVAITKLLLSVGAKVDAKDDDGSSPLDIAYSKKMKELLQGVKP